MPLDHVTADILWSIAPLLDHHLRKDYSLLQLNQGLLEAKS
jgi:hypothetical protein